MQSITDALGSRLRHRRNAFRPKQRNKGTSSSSGTRLHRNSGSVEAAQEPNALSKRKHENSKGNDGCALIIFGLISVTVYTKFTKGTSPRQQGKSLK
jgi:hypothetical protein